MKKRNVYVWAMRFLMWLAAGITAALTLFLLGYVLIKGYKVPIVGRVCMDQMMVDVTEIPEEIAIGDRVTLIGQDGDHVISAEELGDLSGRFNYELVCDLGNRIPRIYFKDGKIKEIRDYFEK